MRPYTIPVAAAPVLHRRQFLVLDLSPLLGDQLNLWNNLTSKCNTTFTNDILGSAGYNSNQTDGTMLGAASRAGIHASSLLAIVVSLGSYLVL